MDTTEARIAPRPGTPGEFDMVEATVHHDERGFPRTRTDGRRAPVPATRVADLHAIVAQHRVELEAPCDEPTVRDGVTERIAVHASGVDHVFVCRNASTPAFDELASAFGTLRAELLPRLPSPADGPGLDELLRGALDGPPE